MKSAWSKQRIKASVSAQRGFTLVTGVFLIGILAALSIYMIALRVIQDSSAIVDTLGTRAYAAARSGAEWGAYQALRPGPCVAAVNSFAMAGTLAGFTVTVTTTPTTYNEGGTTVTICNIQSNACNIPAAGACPNAAGGTNYAERQMTIVTGQ